MATITFGLSQTYDWSATYWSTLTNVQNTYTTDVATADGWVLLAFVSPTTVHDWDDLTGWTASNSGTYTNENLPAGQLHTSATRAGSNSYATRSKVWANGGVANNDWVLSFRVQFNQSYSSNGRGYQQSFADGSAADTSYLTHNSGGNFYYAGSNTSVPVDTRWHILQLRRPSGGQWEIYFEGKYMTKFTATVDATNAGRRIVGPSAYTSDGTLECHEDWVKYWATSAAYETSDGVMESDATSAVFDAGASAVHNKIVWTSTTANSTTLTVEARTADTSGDLAAASYFAVTSGTCFAGTDQKRYIQIRVTLSDEGAGVYTPVLKTMTLTTVTTVASTNYLHSKYRRNRVPV